MEEHNTEIQNFGSKNILEEFYELIEKHRLSTNKDFKLGNFYDYLSEFDDAYQKFNTKNGEKTARLVYNQLVNSLYPFLVIFKFKGFSDRPVFYAFKRFIRFYTLLLTKSDSVTSDFFFRKNISINFPSLWKGEFFDLINSDNFNLNLISPKNYNSYDAILGTAEHQISEDFGIHGFSFTNEIRNFDKVFSIYTKDYEVLEYDFNVDNFEFVYVDSHYEMTVDIGISFLDNDAQKLSEVLFQIVTSLSNVNNNKTEFEYISTGSLYAKIKIWMKDLVAKEETKAIIETTKEVVSKTLTAGQVSHSEVKKKSAETDKLKSEKKLIEKELLDKPSDFDAQMSNALDLEKKALENEKLKNEIISGRLDHIERLSDLSAKGIIEADMVRIDINEVLYLLKEDNELKETRSDIDDIA
jgi:hypothetical protein